MAGPAEILPRERHVETLAYTKWRNFDPMSRSLPAVCDELAWCYLHELLLCLRRLFCALKRLRNIALIRSGLSHCQINGACNRSSTCLSTKTIIYA